MRHAIIENGSPVEWKGKFAVDDLGVQHPLRPMSKADKAALGVYEIERQSGVPQGYVRTGWELAFEEGDVYERPTCERMPIEDYRTVLYNLVKAAYSRALAPISAEYPPTDRDWETPD